MSSTIESIMTRCPVIPVIVIDEPEQAVPLAQALVNGGLSVLEVTLRTAYGLQAIKDIKQALPEAIVGAGTVLSASDVKQAVAAGAEFLVSPGSPAGLITAAKSCDVPMLPGVSTPTEAMMLLEQGFTHMKFFPAQAAGGVPMLKSIAGPLPQIKFCPTGGINPANAGDYLALDNVLCIGGSWMLDVQAIARKDWQQIEELAREAAQLSAC